MTVAKYNNTYVATEPRRGVVYASLHLSLRLLCPAIPTYSYSLSILFSPTTHNSASIHVYVYVYVYIYITPMLLLLLLLLVLLLPCTSMMFISFSISTSKRQLTPSLFSSVTHSFIPLSSLPTSHSHGRYN